MTQTKLTKEAKELIFANQDLSNRQLQLIVETQLGIKTSHVAIGNFKKKHLTNTFPISKTKHISKKDIQVKKPKPQENRRTVRHQKMSFSEFMTKMEKSDSYSAKLLRKKLAVKGKNRQINLDRVLRIIQYTVEILQE